MPGFCRAFEEILRESKNIVAFSGAGISTESGIADYRSPGGRWDNHTPVYFQDFIADEEARMTHWAYKRETWEEFKDSKPNIGHTILAAWYKTGRLKGVITQNIDNLHQAGGMPDDAVIELHGSNARIMCVGKKGDGCGHLEPARPFFEKVKSEPWPVCPRCEGWLKPSTVSFGQSLDQANMMRASQLCQAADLMLVLGSSLVVSPANEFPLIAQRVGAKLVILNRQETPLDSRADLVLHQPIGEVMGPLEKVFEISDDIADMA